MCGLAGFLDPAAPVEVVGYTLALSMANALRSRGPDGEGAWSEGPVALGHRRLAILDLSPAGSQPMLSACGRWALAFNGEIYNHLEIRAALERDGLSPSWRGHSDTETLLAAIAAHGVDEALRAASGMFALAAWDRKERRLFLARDRMGEKPLYWGWAGSALVFGSELKALATHPNFIREVCRDALSEYLRFSYVPAPRSIFRGVYKLEPGTILQVNSSPPGSAPAAPLRPDDCYGSISVRRYWSLREVIEEGASAPIDDETKAADALETTLGLAVRRQMISDVPVGAFLSGGVDSSTITALMRRAAGRPIKTFTVGFDEAGFDESPSAEAVARHLGTEHYTLRVTDLEAREVIPSLPEIYDEPFADSSQIPTHIVCRAARLHAAVALSGDGGDELFGGYNRYFWGPRIWSKFAWAPAPLRRLAGRAILATPLGAVDAAAAFINKLRPGSLPELVGDKAHRLASRLRTVTTVDDLYASLVTEWPEPKRLLPLLGTEPSGPLADPMPPSAEDPAARMMIHDMRTYLPDDILTKVDRAAMAISLETRVPFLDPEVVALSARIPTPLKIRDGSGKWLLRQVLHRYVPQELVDRPKAGFGIPVGLWLRGPLRPWAEDLLSENKLPAGGLLDPRPIRAIWAEHLSGRRDWTTRLWIILMFQAWRERWL